MGASDPSRGAALAGFDREILDADPSVVYALDPDLRLAYVNPAWSRFARENGAGADFFERWGLGAFFPDAIADSIRGYYVERLTDVLAEGERWDHEYECSTPERFRRYCMSTYALGGGVGLLVVNTLVEERPHGQAGRASSLEDGHYIDAHGIVVMCAHCRRVRRASGPERWDWVPDAVRTPHPRTSHGLCAICAAYYWGV